MAQFATVPELEAYLQTTFDGAAAAAADQALTLASASIQNETHQRLEAVADEVVTFEVTPSTGLIFLPELPVTAVTAVSIDGTALLSTDYKVDLQTGILRRKYGRAWGVTSDSIVSVTYSHGYAVIPDDIKAETLRRAAQTLESPGGASVLEVAGPYSWRTTGSNNADESGPSPVIDRYRVVSVA